MIETQISCHFMGSNFSPQKVMSETGLYFSKYQEVGDIEIVGPQKGKPTEMGSATLSSQDLNLSSNTEDDLFQFVEVLIEHIDIIREHGANDIYLDLAVFYKYQCNMSFKPEVLKRISELQIPFNISCYDNTDE